MMLKILYAVRHPRGGVNVHRDVGCVNLSLCLSVSRRHTCVCVDYQPCLGGPQSQCNTSAARVRSRETHHFSLIAFAQNHPLPRVRAPELKKEEDDQVVFCEGAA